MKETHIGTVVNFFSRPMAAAVIIEGEFLRKGDAIRIASRSTDLYHRIKSIEVDGRPVESVSRGETAGIKLDAPVRRHDAVFRLED